MARRSARRSPRAITPTAFARLERDLEQRTDEIRSLKRRRETDIERMGATQAEIDHLRALLSRT